MTKTRIKNALRTAGLFTPETTTIQGRNRDFSIDTTDPRVVTVLEGLGIYVFECMRNFDGSRSWRGLGADFGSRVPQATRDLIAANID